MTNFKHIYIYITSTIILFGGLLFGYWGLVDGVYVNIPIVEKIDDMKLKTDKDSYRVGDVVGVYNSFCKNVSLPVTIDAMFVDGQKIAMESKVINLSPGCYGIDKPYLVPIAHVTQGVYPGVWKITYKSTFHVNPIKTIVYQRQTQDFTVIN